MAEYRYGLTEKEYQDVGRKFDELWRANGRIPPRMPNEKTAYEAQKDEFIKNEVKTQESLTGAISAQMSSPLLKGIQGQQQPFAQALQGANQAQRREQMTHYGQQTPPSMFGGMFQSTQLPQQAQPDPMQPPMPPMPPQGGAQGQQGGMGGIGAPRMQQPKFTSPEEQQAILELIRKGSGMQVDAAQGAYAGMQGANAAYDEQTGAPPNLLDFVRQARAANPRPERSDAQLTDSDKYAMLTRMGLGVLSRNREGFGKALGESGKEALDFGDKTLNQRYQDAVAKYTEKMAEIGQDANLTATDYRNKEVKAASVRDKSIALIEAKAKVDTAGIPGLTAEVGFMEKRNSEKDKNQLEMYKQAVELAKTQMSANAHLGAARIGAQSREGGTGDGKYTAQQYLAAADKLEKSVEAIMMVTDIPEEQRQALATEYRKKALLFRKAGMNAMGM